MQIKQVMTNQVVSVEPNTPITEVARILFDKQLTGLPVIDQTNKLVGIITEYDLLSRKKHIHIPTFLELVNDFDIKNDSKMANQAKEISKLKVKELMSTGVFTVTEETDIKEAAKLFTEKHINPLPVVNDKGNLVGIISRTDIIKLLK